MRSAGGVVILIAVLTVFVLVLALPAIAQSLQSAKTATGVTSALSSAFDTGTLVVGALVIMVAGLLVTGLVRR
jgi:hypothetical protein